MQKSLIRAFVGVIALAAFGFSSVAMAADPMKAAGLTTKGNVLGVEIVELKIEASAITAQRTTGALKTGAAEDANAMRMVVTWTEKSITKSGTTIKREVKFEQVASGLRQRPVGWTTKDHTDATGLTSVLVPGATLVPYQPTDDVGAQSSANAELQRIVTKFLGEDAEVVAVIPVSAEVLSVTDLPIADQIVRLSHPDK